MNKFDKNLQMIKDNSLRICANCVYYGGENNFCGFHRKNVTDLDSCANCLTLTSAVNDMSQNNNDPINPNHYKQGKLTCDEVCKAICANKTGIEAAYVFNIAKYIYRYNMKDGIKDVRKAREYCEMLIKHLEEKKLTDE